MPEVMGDIAVPPGGQDCTWEKEGWLRESMITNAHARTAFVFMTGKSFLFFDGL